MRTKWLIKESQLQKDMAAIFTVTFLYFFCSFSSSEPDSLFASWFTSDIFLLSIYIILPLNLKLLDAKSYRCKNLLRVLWCSACCCPLIKYLRVGFLALLSITHYTTLNEETSESWEKVGHTINEVSAFVQMNRVEWRHNNSRHNKLVVTDSTLTVQMHTNEELLRLTRILRSTWPHLCKTCHV